MDQVRVSNKYKWLPKSKRNSRFGGKSSSSDARYAKYWIVNDNDSIYFVNDSDDIINKLIYSSSGMATIDDEDVAAVGVKEKSYDNVLSGEAVKISEYDVIYDSDFVLQYEVTTIIKNSTTTYRSRPTKGGIVEDVLAWK